MRVIGVIAVLVAITAGGCVSQLEYRKLQDKVGRQAMIIEKYEKDLAALTSENEALKVQVSDRDAKIKTLEGKLSALHGEHEEFRRSVNSKLEQAMEELARANKESMSFDPSTGVVTLSDAILFDTAKDDLKEDGQQLLRKIAQTLKENDGGEEILIDGHTDNVPVSKPETLKKFPKGNWQLSGARSLSVLLFLHDECGIEPSRMRFAGFSEYHPKVPNDTTEGKQQNRRVELKLLSPPKKP